MSFQPSFAGPQPDSRIDRTTFIRRAYLHLAVAIVGFIVLSAAWSFIGVGEYALDVLLAGGRYSWLVVLGAFMLVGMLATRLADNAGNNQTQLIGLGIYVLAESLIFAPLLTVAAYINPSSIGAAAITTLLLVGGLTFTAFSIKKRLFFSALVSDYGWVHCFWRDYCQRHLRLLAGRLVFCADSTAVRRVYTLRYF